MLAVPQAFTQYYSWLPFTVFVTECQAWVKCFVHHAIYSASQFFEGFCYYHPHLHVKKLSLEEDKKVVWPVSGKASVCTRVSSRVFASSSPHTLSLTQAGSAMQLFWNIRETSLAPLLRPLLLSRLYQRMRLCLKLPVVLFSYLEDNGRIDI